MDNSLDLITIRQPDDWHLHLRDGDLLKMTVLHTAKTFHRAVVMPNLQPPVTSIQSAIDYKKRILSAIPQGKNFVPLMTAYLTNDFAPDISE